jgi:hypothetical protein
MFDNVERVSRRGVAKEGEPMAAPPPAAQPTTGQKLTAEALGTAFLVCAGALTPQLTRLWDAPVHTPALRWER